MKIYLIPGLGFDRRMFQKLDLSGFEIEFLDWIEPRRNELISEYAKRLAAPIDDASDAVIIGHSLGGVMAQEIAVFKKIKKLILISTMKSRKENPLQFKIIKPLGIHHFFTKELSNATVKFWGKKYDYAPGEEQELFKKMIGKQSNHYLKWALKQISTWKKKNDENETPFIQIHGTNDKNFPIGLIEKPDYVIENGGHFMAFNRAEEISKIIRAELRRN